MEKSLPKPIDALEFRRDQMQWTQKEIALRLGMNPTHYNMVLKGNRRLSLDQVRAAVEVLGISAEIMLQRFPCEPDVDVDRQETLRKIDKLETRIKELKASLS